MTDPVTVEQLRLRRLAEERERGISSAESAINQVIYHLRVAAYYNNEHNLQLELPREPDLLTAMQQCARLKQLDKEPQ